MNLFELKELLRLQGAQIAFCGSFSHGIIEELGLAVRKYLENGSVQKSALMDVFSVYVEAAQNVRNYTVRRLSAGADPQLAPSSILVIARKGDRFEVRVGNAVLAEDAAPLVDRVDRLASLDKAGLKALYKEQLRRERPAGETGAGLGLIDMARRSSAPLQCELTPLPDGHAYFSLRVVI